MSQLIIGHGLEILETNHIKEYMERSGEDWEMEHLTATERRTTELGSSRIQYLAGRFAVKQAVLKILGISVCSDCPWLDIEVQRLPTGQPALVLSGKCQEIAAEFGITKWLLSISHTSSYVAASVLALRGNVTDFRVCSKRFSAYGTKVPTTNPRLKAGGLSEVETHPTV